jgi:hypothetical protein
MKEVRGHSKLDLIKIPVLTGTILIKAYFGVAFTAINKLERLSVVTFLAQPDIYDYGRSLSMCGSTSYGRKLFNRKPFVL